MTDAVAYHDRPVEPVACRCRVCRCTEDNPCRLGTGDACMWINAERTLCNRPSCVLEDARRKKQEAAKRFRSLNQSIAQQRQWRRESRGMQRRRLRRTKGKAA